MTKKSSGKKPRKQHTDQFKAEALGLAETVGVAAAARDLGVQESQLYTWRRKQKEALTVSQTERDQSSEIVRLKKLLARKDEELAIVKKAAAYFARDDLK